jgi:hypothetical protein
MFYFSKLSLYISDIVSLFVMEKRGENTLMELTLYTVECQKNVINKHVIILKYLSFSGQFSL